MLPYSRGKRLLELSLQSQAKRQKQPNQKRQKQPNQPTRSATKVPDLETEDEGDLSILDISASQLVDVVDDLDISFSVDENIALADLPSLSSTLKVANYVIHSSVGSAGHTLHNDTGVSVDLDVASDRGINDKVPKPILVNHAEDIKEISTGFEWGGVEAVASDIESTAHRVAVSKEECIGAEATVDAADEGAVGYLDEGSYKVVLDKLGGGSEEDAVIKVEKINEAKVDGIEGGTDEGWMGCILGESYTLAVDKIEGGSHEGAVVEGESGGGKSKVGGSYMVVVDKVGSGSEEDAVVKVESRINEANVGGIEGGSDECAVGCLDGGSYIVAVDKEEGGSHESAMAEGKCNGGEAKVDGKEGCGNEAAKGCIEGGSFTVAMSKVRGSSHESAVAEGDNDEVKVGQTDGGRNEATVDQPESDVIEAGAAGTTSKETKMTKKVEKKQRREQGKSYTGRHLNKENKQFVEIIKEERLLGERCKCKAAYYKCSEISDIEREKIHSDIWKMTWGEKKTFVKTCLEVQDVKERRGKAEESRRNHTIVFTLKGSSQRYRVCKQMFLSTTGLKSWWVLNTVKEDKVSEVSIAAPVSDQNPAELSSGILFIRNFIERLPKMPSHYCRKDTSRMYLEPCFNSFSDIYREYVKVCVDENVSSMSRTVFIQEVKAQNISIFLPRKDQCDLCCEYEKGNTTEEIYRMHRAKKEAAQAQKTHDKLLAQNSRTKVLCMDVQRVLLSPSLKASALYYKTKLQVHNFTIYDLYSRDVSCFVWNECEGAVTANEFASCLFSYLEENVTTFDKVIIYSDGCTYQNRNRMLATALRYFCVKHQKTIEQKILERGHTQMEVDSVHATIERRLKNADIYSPLDYVQLIKAARLTPKPYEVQYLKFDFFRDFDKFGEGEVKSIKPSKTKNVTDICALRYDPDGSLHYKLNFSDEWQSLALGRGVKLPAKDPSKLYCCRRKIKKTKFDHLQSLKPVLPSDVHYFYDSLPHL